MHPRTALSRRIRKAGAAVRAGLFLVLTLIALTLAAPSTAYADFACNITGDDGYAMDSPGSNGEGIIPAVRQWEKQVAGGGKSLSDSTGMVSGTFPVSQAEAADYTLYELNGMRGLNWSMTFKGKGDAAEDNGTWGSGADSCKVMAYVNNAIADIVFNGTKFLTRFSISIKEMASNPSPFAGLYAERDSAVNTLRLNVFDEKAVTVMILLVALWVFGKWRKGEMREIWAGVTWTALSTIAVTVFLTGNTYHNVVQGTDDWIARANAELSSSVLSGVSGEAQPPCDLSGEGRKKGRVGLRLSSCAMYDTLAFRPWAMGQFGEPGRTCIFQNGTGSVEDGVCASTRRVEGCYWGVENGPRCADLRVRHAVAQSWTNIDDQREGVDKFKEWEEIRKQIAGGENVPDKKIYPVAFNDWAGKNATDRVGIAFYSLVAAFIVGVMVLVLSALTLLWHAVTLILVIMLPLVALLGIHPSQQKLLKSWLETFIHAFVLRAGFGVILTLLLLLYQMILPAQISLGTQLLMLLLVTIAVVMMLKKLIAGGFTPQVAGGEDAIGIRDAGNKVAAMAPGMAVSTARTSGRVASTAARGTTRAAGSTVRGTAWAVDRLAGGKGRERLQKWGWLGQSKREQRQTAHQHAQKIRSDYEDAMEQRRASEAARDGGQTAPQPATSAGRGRRVSGSANQQAPQGGTSAGESRPAPLPAQAQPAPAQPQPAAPRPRVPAPEAPVTPRQSAPPAVPRQPAPPAAPQAAPPATPPAAPPRDPRGPSGRV